MVANTGALPMYWPMRCSADHWITGPTSFRTSRRRPNAVKDLPFESGILTVQPARQRFSIDFYLTAMLFIVFDIETVKAANATLIATINESLAIADTDTSTHLHDKLAVLGARLIVDTLGSFSQLNAQVQSTEGVTYAAKILKEEALIDWRQPASVLSQRIRAFDPFPGAHTVLNQQTLKVWSASALTDYTHATPGTVLRILLDR